MLVFPLGSQDAGNIGQGAKGSRFSNKNNRQGRGPTRHIASSIFMLQVIGDPWIFPTWMSQEVRIKG